MWVSKNSAPSGVTPPSAIAFWGAADADKEEQQCRTHQVWAVEVHRAPLRCGVETTVSVGSWGRRERTRRPAGGPSRGDRLVGSYERFRRVGGRLGFRVTYCTRPAIGVHLEKPNESIGISSAAPALPGVT